MAQAAMVAGGGLKMFGTMEKAKEDTETAEFNAQTARQNSIDVQMQAQEMERRARINALKTVGSEQAGYAASGVSGVSAQYVMRQSAAQGELDALTIQHNADLKSAAYGREAIQQHKKSENIQKMLPWQVFGDMFGGASQMIGNS